MAEKIHCLKGIIIMLKLQILLKLGIKTVMTNFGYVSDWGHNKTVSVVCWICCFTS